MPKSGECCAVAHFNCGAARPHKASAALDFIDALARATGARVAASTQLVGAAARGGAWELDLSSHAKGARAPLTAEGVTEYAGLMVPKSWVSGPTWSTATWTPAGAPATGDAVTISGLSGTLTYDVASSPPSLLSLTINAPTTGGTGATLAVGSHTLNVNNAATSTLTLSGSGHGNAKITIANGTINAGGVTGGGIVIGNSDVLSGTGTINITPSGTISGAGTITETGGGTLEINGAISSIDTLTVGGTSSDILKLDAASSATNVTFSGSSGTLELASGGTLTVTTALAIGANTVKLDGASSTLTDAANATIGTGTITGQGKFAAAVTGTSGQAAHITANGGILEVTGAITSAGNNAIVLTTTASTDTLKLDAAGNAVKTVTLNGGTLELQHQRHPNGHRRVGDRHRDGEAGRGRHDATDRCEHQLDRRRYYQRHGHHRGEH